MSFDRKTIVGYVGVDLTGSLYTEDKITTGSGKAGIFGLYGNYTYTSTLNKYRVRNTLLEGKIFEFQCPFDFASLTNGVMAPLPTAANSRIRVANSDRTAFSVALSNDEVWQMYGDILDYIVRCAINSKIDLGNLKFSTATLEYVIKDGMIHTMAIELEGTANLGKVEMSFSGQVDKAK